MVGIIKTIWPKSCHLKWNPLFVLPVSAFWLVDSLHAVIWLVEVLSPIWSDTGLVSPLSRCQAPPNVRMFTRDPEITPAIPASHWSPASQCWPLIGLCWPRHVLLAITLVEVIPGLIRAEPGTPAVTSPGSTYTGSSATCGVMRENYLFLQLSP